MKQIKNLSKFTNTLPYASEIFGVYQPLLGWASRRSIQRIMKGFTIDRNALLNNLLRQTVPLHSTFFQEEDCVIEIEHISAGTLERNVPRQQKSFLLNLLREELPPRNQMSPDRWTDLVHPQRIEELLMDPVRVACMEDIRAYCDFYRENAAKYQEMKRPLTPPTTYSKQRVDFESKIGGMLIYLLDNQLFDQFDILFYPKPYAYVDDLLNLFKAEDPFALIDPKHDLDRVGISPIGITHLFRQYFFEFDTFLGPSVGHIWLSPGSTVEMVEISTRKTIVERTYETGTEIIRKSEKSITQEDELADAVKDENQNNIKAGVSVSANEKFSVMDIVDIGASQSGSFDYANTQAKAREQTHKRMRQQTEKLSTEIRQNFKSTFRTVSEATDTTSKRYLLTNATNELINYELRRKMRQVGVQVQDIGTYLCWQTFADEPGRRLDLSNLLHIAQTPDLAHIPQPELIVPAPPINEEKVINIPFVGLDTDDTDQAYTNGSETEVAAVFDATEHIESNFRQEVYAPQANYTLAHVNLDAGGSDAKLSLRDLRHEGKNKWSFVIHLDYVHFHEQPAINVKAVLHWAPDQDLGAIETKNKERMAQFTNKQEYEFKKAYFEAARERIKLAAAISSRPYDDLREEERIVIYRILIQDLLTKGLNIPDDKTRHVVSELLNSIFDVDKMLYFVAPEWWKPRDHYKQFLGGIADKDNPTQPKTYPLTSENLVGWNGPQAARENNYYITEDSEPAKLGSSLGWLLQLDGDNLRNAFLNAPWVKAIIPIRPGKERAAISWLKSVEGTDGLEDKNGNPMMYNWQEGDDPALQGKTMLEALEILADQVKEKHDSALKTRQFDDPGNPDDANTITATPVDRVYEHGFYPLQGGFRANVGEDFEIFDQWIEVLPTDQVVAVPVKYDPKTGMQI
ncbi:MAG: hypothetical protein KC419_25295 [Anaerolineales bacterium]|nr:hypothetical protein [Anaerolineales bacterium]